MGFQVDLFNLGYTLWNIIFGSKCIPFRVAQEGDQFFECLMSDNHRLFWQEQANIQNTPVSKASELTRMLMLSLMDPTPEMRSSIPDTVAMVNLILQ